MHDRLSVPFTSFEPKFQNEMAGLEFSMLEARRKGGPIFLRARVPRGPRLKRHGLGNLSRVFPFALDVRHLPESDYASCRVPYKVVFTPDKAMMDSNGDPFPCVIIDMDENGMVGCVWRKGAWDYENIRVRHLEKEIVNSERGRVPAHAVIWRAKMIPEKRLRSGGDFVPHDHTVENPTQRAPDGFATKAERASAGSRSLGAANYLRPLSDDDLAHAPAEMKSGDSPGNVTERGPRKRTRTTEEDEPHSDTFPKKPRVSRVTG
ncbi:hypothetical protein BS17DRAFT_281189 [Gyrodon lividus]|nr:hypothetical protein BS17DRAFT_281189 [Gyrodon lividus]